MKSNKGSAIVSVLVGVAFIMILASTLLLVTYTNYQTKLVNTKSVDNFYETEVAVNQINAGIRNIALNCTTDDLFAKMKSELGVTGAAGSERYDASKLQDFITTTDPSITVNVSNTTAAGASIENDVTNQKIIIKDVQVRCSSATNELNTIETDIEVHYNSTAGGVPTGSLEISDFSVIAGNSIEVNNSGVNLYGNCYIGCGSTPTTISAVKLTGGPATIKPALQLVDGSYINILSDKVLIIGDVYINSGLMTIVGNNVTVYGTIYITGNSTILCTGELETTGGIVKLSDAGDIKYFPASLGDPDATKITDTNRIANLQKLPADIFNPVPSPTDPYTNMSLFNPQIPSTDGTHHFTMAQLSTNCPASNDAQRAGQDGYLAKFFNETNLNQTGQEKTLYVYTKATKLNLIGTSMESTVMSMNGVVINGGTSGEHHATLSNMSKSGYLKSLNTITENVNGLAGVNNKKIKIGDAINPNSSAILTRYFQQAASGTGASTTYNSITSYSNWEKK